MVYVQTKASANGLALRCPLVTNAAGSLNPQIPVGTSERPRLPRNNH